MRKFAVAALVITTCFAFAANALADSVAREKCVAKCKEAIQLIQDKGLDPALATINNKDGGFVWKDSYLFVVDFQGKTVANAYFPHSAGMDIIHLKDKDGRMVIQEMIEIAKTKGEGWLEYMWPKPEDMHKPLDQRTFSKKVSYVLRVPGQDMFAVAGVHE